MSIAGCRPWPKPCAEVTRMKTNDLITFLSTGVEPVERRQLARTIGVGVAVAAAVAIAAMLAIFGPRTDGWDVPAVGYLLLKLLFTVGIVVPSTFYLVRLARPGGQRHIRS